MTEYRKLASAAMAKCCGYDSAFPNKSEVMISAWAEALEDGGITELCDVLMAVRVMYRNYGDPGWRPTPRVLVATAQECRNMRVAREKERDAVPEIEEPKYNFREFKARHPEVKFPKLGKDLKDA